MKQFHLERTEDVSGTSGIGTVAEGVIFNNGKCAMSWLTNLTSITIYDNIEILEKIHSHEGRTKVIFKNEKV